MTLPDKEEFLAWKAHPMTQWVFRRLQQQTQRQTVDLQDRLLQSAAMHPSQWAESQPQAAYLKGRFEQATEIAASEFEDFLTQDEAVMVETEK